MIPMSDVLERVSSKLSELLGELKSHGTTILGRGSTFTIRLPRIVEDSKEAVIGNPTRSGDAAPKLMRAGPDGEFRVAPKAIEI